MESEVEFKFLNVDEQRFYHSRCALLTSLLSDQYLYINCSTNDHGQCLVAGANTPFTMHEAIELCRKLKGVDE